MDLPEGLASSGALEIRARLSSISAGKVLDVATANGDFIQTLMKALRDYDSFVGIDHSEDEVKKAKTAFDEEPVEILQMDAEDMDFEDGSFDMVSISHSLHHLANIDAVLSEMKRVLKPGGHVIVQENYSDPGQTEAQMTDMLAAHWDAEIDTLLGETHFKTLRKRKIRGHVEALRLEELEVFDTTHPVKCLFCEKVFECADPLNDNIVSSALEEIDNNLARLEGCPDADAARLAGEGERLKERIRQFGSSSPSTLFLVGRK